MPTADRFHLQRFADAQVHTHDTALAELHAGRKTTHWSWYVLPQVAGLGASPMSVRYAIASVDEARAYLAHPVLGPRLHACVAAMNAHDTLTARQVLGDIDAQKFHACLTLFLQAAPDDHGLRAALARYFGGEPHGPTLALLAGGD